jgi:hypothetical protein
MPVWGIWLDDAFCFSTGSTSVKARNLARNDYCVVGVEPADDAIILEGTAELVTDPGFKRRFGKAYEAKYKWDMEGFDEPVYIVRPRVAFAFSTAEDAFIGSSTRWTFD